MFISLTIEELKILRQSLNDTMDKMVEDGEDITEELALLEKLDGERR